MKKLMYLLITMTLLLSLFTYATSAQAADSPALTDDFVVIENEILIGVTPAFNGRLNDDLKALGVTSIEQLSDMEGAIIYLVKTDGAQEDIIENLEVLNYVEYAEYNQYGTFADDVESSVEVVSQPLTKEDAVEKPKSPMNMTMIIGIVLVIGAPLLVVIMKSRK